MGKFHTLETANYVLKEKNLDSFLWIQSIDNSVSTIKVVDKVYGIYTVDLKSLCPSTNFPIHKERRRAAKLLFLIKKYVGKTINGLKVTDIFYGPDKGYKNKTFYIEYTGMCGHKCTASHATLTRHKKKFSCQSCAATEHGERSKVDGKLKKRSSTYNHWQRIRNTLPDEYKDFSFFRKAAGDKPYKMARLRLIDGKPAWINLQIDEENEDLLLIASAIRGAFRRSSYYKNALLAARIETAEGVRYICAVCLQLFKKKEVQVDHIEAIVSTDGFPLKKETVIDRVFTDKVQILDKKCHSKKSSVENALRRNNKEKEKKNVR